MKENKYWLFPLFTDHDNYDRGMDKFTDFHLYTGSQCNRQCDFCIVSGRPDGWYAPLTEEILDAALELVPADGTIKFYGGEPTIDHKNLIWAIKYLRAKDFHGWFTVFSNGILAERVIDILEADKKTDVVLNYSILHGLDADPIPPLSLRILKEYEADNPNRLYASHAGVFPFGRGVEFVEKVGEHHVIERMETSFDKKKEIGEIDEEAAEAARKNGFRSCPKCRPVLRSDGRFHACPFAVESDSRHYDLGRLGKTSETEVVENFQKFLDWVDETLEPEAARRDIHPCLVCTHHLEKLPAFRDTELKRKRSSLLELIT
ncbi:MAG: radical SAM protein [Pyrinomonadaceae bacterium]